MYSSGYLRTLDAPVHNDEIQGSRWHKQQHDFRSLPVYVRDNTLLALGNNSQKPDYAWNEGTAFQLFNLEDGATAVSEVPAADGAVAFTSESVTRGRYRDPDRRG